MYEIEKNIPLPPLKHVATRKLPFEHLRDPGDSFLVPALDMSNGAVKVAAQRYMKASGVKVTVRRVDGGSRVFLL
jgi:hypothetical protein